MTDPLLSPNATELGFAEAVRPYGGMLARERVQPELLAIFDNVLDLIRGITHSARNPPTPYNPVGDIYIGMIDNHRLNVVALMEKGREFIGFYVGAIAFVHDAFVTLLSDPRVLPSLGSPPKKPPTKDIAGYLLRKKSNSRFYAFSPNAPERILLARNLMLVAVLFLFGHEIGHVVKGHLRLLARDFGAHGLLEYPLTPKDEQERRIRRILEIGADEHGSMVSLNLWGRLTDSSNLLGGPRLNMFWSWAFALNILFRLFDLRTTASTEETHVSHPAPDIRFAHLAVCGLEEVRKRAPHREREFLDSFQSAMREADHIWSALGIPARNFESKRNSVGETVAELRKQLYDLEESGLRRLEEERAANIRKTVS